MSFCIEEEWQNKAKFNREKEFFEGLGYCNSLFKPAACRTRNSSRRVELLSSNLSKCSFFRSQLCGLLLPITITTVVERNHFKVCW